MNDDHESRLLLAIVRERWDLADRIRAEAAPGTEPFMTVARQADVAPWIHCVLDSHHRFDLVGSEIEDRLGEARHKCRVDNLLLVARLEQALDLLLGAGVTPVVLKGVDLMHRFERDLDARSVTDVDLLVRAEEIPTALDVLERAGWKMPPEDRRKYWLRTSHHIPFASAGPVEVEFELHWSLVQESRYRLDPRLLFERARPLDVAGRAVLRLDDHDFVAHLLLHHMSHYFDRQLKWVIDLDQVSRQEAFQWDVVVDRLREWGGSSAAALCVLHLNKLFPGVVPPDAARQLPVPLWRRIATAPFISGHPLELFRGTRNRMVQLYLAAVALEQPSMLPAYLARRASRVRRSDASPVERASSPGDGEAR